MVKTSIRLLICRGNKEYTDNKGKTWSRGTNSRLPFRVNVKTPKICQIRVGLRKGCFLHSIWRPKGSQCFPTSPPGSSRFPIWRRQKRRPRHTAEITMEARNKSANCLQMFAFQRYSHSFPNNQI